MLGKLPQVVRSAGEASRSDEGFRQELLVQSEFAAAVIGGVEVLLAAVLQATAAVGGAWLMVMLALGIATWVAPRIPALYSWTRVIALGSCWIWCGLLAVAVAPALSVAVVAGTLLTAAALVPLSLRQAVLAFVPVVALEFAAPLEKVDLWLLIAIAVAAVAVATGSTAHRWSIYASNLRLVQSTQDLRLIQARALSAEHAASLERLAAALSHELNNPVGALKSAMDTVRQLRSRYTNATDERRGQLDALQDDMLANVSTAADRIAEIVRRLQRVSSLDRATVRPADMNLLLRDVVAMIEAGQNPGAEIVLELRPVPMILCEAQAWNTIFTTLISSALRQCPPGGVLGLASGHRDGDIFVELSLPVTSRAGGNGVDPEFVAEGGRIAAGNWSLFHVRMWIQQQGATLQQTSDPERGLITRVSIPAGSAAVASAG